MIANYIVLILFGVITGIPLAYFMILDKRLKEQWKAESGKSLSSESLFEKFAGKHKNSGENFFINYYKKSQEENEFRRINMPKNGWFAVIIFYAFIGMLFIVIHYSPLIMNWWVYYGSLMIGFFAINIMGGKQNKPINSTNLL